MSGWVDLHCHLLPGVDDGVQTREDSLECLRRAAEAGFSDVVFTRHEMTGVYSTTPENAESLRLSLQSALEEEGITLKLHTGAEHYADDGFLNALNRQPKPGTEPTEPPPPLPTLGRGRALLVEFPLMGMPPFAAELAFRIGIKGFIPVLAHVERYREIAESPRKAGELERAGYRLQLNLGSLVGVYGRRVEKTARLLLNEGIIHAAASDAHGPKWLASTYDRGIKELDSFGRHAVQTLLADNPRRLIYGDTT